MKNNIIYIIILIFLATVSCKDNNNNNADIQTVTNQIISDFPKNIVEPNLLDMVNAAKNLHLTIENYYINPNDSLFTLAKKYWYETRNYWEQSEAFLFGPVATKGLDPSIDDWPISYTELDSVLKSQAVFTEAYINQLTTNLKGFHPIEYILFGFSGKKLYNQINSREKDYLKALSLHLKNTTQQMYDEWVNGYSTIFMTAGSSGNIYKTKQDAIIEMANGMIGIIGEVADGKIKEPFEAMDSMLEESPFSQNSWTDFTKNIQGVKNVYEGKYIIQGKGLQAFVNLVNKSLDLKIKQHINLAVQNLQSYKSRFGQDLYNNRVAIQNTMNILNELKTILENELITTIQQHIKN